MSISGSLLFNLWKDPGPKHGSNFSVYEKTEDIMYWLTVPIALRVTAVQHRWCIIYRPIFWEKHCSPRNVLGDYILTFQHKTRPLLRLTLHTPLKWSRLKKFLYLLSLCEIIVDYILLELFNSSVLVRILLKIHPYMTHRWQIRY